MPGSSPYLLQPGQFQPGTTTPYNGPVPNTGGGSPGSSMNPYDPNSNPYANVNPNADPNAQNPNNPNLPWQTMAGPGSASQNWGGIVDTTDQNPLASAAGQYMQGQQAGSQAAQQQSYLQAQQLAQGKGPSLATQLLQQNANQAMSNQNAMASSASGSQLGAARRQAMMSNANTMQGLGSAAASARAQEQLGAMQMQGQIAGQSRAQDLALAGGETGMIQNQANLNLGEQGVQNQQQQFEQGRMDKYIGAIASMAGGMMGADVNMGGGDGPTGSSLHLKEPNGPSHWILREEPNFLLAVNARTGEHRKILTAPLSPDEHRQAMAKHGAGPIGSDNPRNLYTGDFDMSQMQKWSGAGQDNTGLSSGPPSSSGPSPTPQPNAQTPTKKSPLGQAGNQISSNTSPTVTHGKDYMVDLQKSPLQSQGAMQGADVNLGGGESQPQPNYVQQFRQSYDSSDDSTPAAKAGSGSTNNSIGALTGADADLGGRRLTAQDNDVVQSAMDNADPNTSPNNGYVPMEYWGKYLEGKPGPSDYNWTTGPRRGSKLNREAAYEPLGIQRKEKGPEAKGDYTSPKGDLRAADANLGGSPPPAAQMTGADKTLAGMGYNPGGYGLRQTTPDIYNDDKASAALVADNKARAQQLDIDAERLKQEDIKSQGPGDKIVHMPSYYHKQAEQNAQGIRGLPPRAGSATASDWQQVDPMGVSPTDPTRDQKIYNLPPGTYNPDFNPEQPGEMHMDEESVPVPAKAKPAPKPDAAHPDAVAADLHMGGAKAKVDLAKSPLSSMGKTGAVRGLSNYFRAPKLDSAPKSGSLLAQKFGKTRKVA